MAVEGTPGDLLLDQQCLPGRCGQSTGQTAGLTNADAHSGDSEYVRKEAANGLSITHSSTISVLTGAENTCDQFESL